MVDPQDLRVREQSKANGVGGGKENQLKRKMAGNNLLHFIARAQPHIWYQSWNKPNQDTTKKKPQNNTNKISNQNQKKHSEVTQREASQDCSDVTDQCSNKKKNKKKGGGKH